MTAIGLNLSLGRRLSDFNKAPSDILLTNSYVANTESVGFVVGNFVVIDPDIDDTHTFSITPTTYFTIVDDELRVNASLASAGSTQNITVTATDQKGKSVSKIFAITISAPDTGNDGGLGDGTFFPDDGFTLGPDSTQANGGTVMSGKSSGKAIFIKDVGNLIPNSKVSCVYTTDFDGMKKLGVNCATGFGWYDDVSDNFHLVVLSGDGAGGLVIKQIYGSANFKGNDSGWTFVTYSVPSNGTFSGTKRIRLLVNSTGSTYSLLTGSSNYKSIDNWTTEISGKTPTPFATCLAAPRFGFCLYTPSDDHGSFMIPVTWWREQHFEGALKYRTTAQTYTAGSGLVDYQVNVGPAYDPRSFFATGTSYYANMNNYAGRRCAGGISENKESQIDTEVRLRAFQLDNYTYGSGDDKHILSGTNQNAKATACHSFPSAAMDSNSGIKGQMQHLATTNDLGDTSQRGNWIYGIMKPKHWHGSLVRASSDAAYPQDTDSESTLGTVVYDELDMWDGTSRYVCPSGLNGRYFRAYANLEFDDSTGYAAHYINVSNSGLVFRHLTSGSGNNYMNIVTPPFRMFTNGYVRLMNHHVGNGDRNLFNTVRTWFGLELMDENFMGVYCYGNSGQTIQINGSDNIINNVSTLYDVGSWRTNSTTMTVPTGVTKVSCYGQLRLSAGLFGGYPIDLFFKKNGSMIPGLGSYSNTFTGNSYNIDNFCSAPVIGTSGDAFTFRARVSGFSTQTVDTGANNMFAVWAEEHNR